MPTLPLPDAPIPDSSYREPTTNTARTAQFLTVSEAARFLGVHPNTVRAWTRQGLLTCRRINARGDRRYAQEDLDRFVADSGDHDGLSKRLAQAEEQIRRAELLITIGGEIGRQLVPSHVLTRLVERTADLFRADHAGIFTRTPSGNYRADVTRNLSATYVSAVERAPVLPFAALAGEEGRVVSVADVADHPRSGDLGRMLEREGINTLTVAPLQVNGEGLGTLALYHDQPYHWSDDDLALLGRLADHGATVINNARNYSRMATWAAQLQSIQQLGTRLTRLRSVVDIGQNICTELNQLIACHNIRVYRVAGDDCIPVAWRGEIGEYEDEDVDQLRLKVGEGITGWVAGHGVAQNLGNAAADSRAQTIPGTDDDLDESLLLAPMLFDDEVIGVIVLAKLGLNQFGPDDLRVLEIYASIAAQAMANADATERLRAQSAELERQLSGQRELLRVTESILTTLDPQTLLEEIAERLQTIVPVDNIAVSVHDAAARRLRGIFARGVHAAQYIREDIADDAGLSGEAVRLGEALLVQDALADTRLLHFDDLGPQPGAVICAPLLSGEGVQGILTLERLGTDAWFRDEEFELVKLFAAHVSIALRNAAVHRAVELRAETDPLTGLLNHGALTEHIERLVEQRSRFAMLFVDLDFFKTYNDNLGHPAGNDMLQHIAEVLRASCRDSDLVFRFGGDEFAVLLPQTNLSGARVVAEKIRRAIGRLTTATGGKVPISCSVGIGVYPKDGHDANSIIVAADRACYAAKRLGRDRIATAVDGLALATEFRPTEPTSPELRESTYEVA